MVFSSVSKKIELKKVLLLTFPILATQLSLASMGVVDTVMAGELGTDNLSALALATGITFPFLFFMIGILTAVSVFNSHAFGENAPEKIRYWTQQGMYAVSFLCFSIFLILYFNEFLLGGWLQSFDFVQQNQKVYELAKGYLRAVSFGYIFIGFFLSLRVYLEPQGLIRPVIVVALIGVVLNVIFNRIFMFGFGVIPAMEVVGAGYSTSLVEMIMFSLLLIYTIKSSRFKNRRLFGRVYRFDFRSIKKIYLVGFPVAISILLETVIFAILPFLFAVFGKEAVAAGQVAINIMGLVYQLPIAFGFACSIRLGNILGAKEVKKAIKLSYFYTSVMILLGIVTMVIFIVLREYIVSIYTDDMVVFTIAVNLLVITAYLQISDNIMAGLNGVFRAFKDTKVPMYILVSSYWLLGIPFGYIFSKTSMGIDAYFWGLFLAMTVCSLLFFIRFKFTSKKWIRASRKL